MRFYLHDLNSWARLTCRNNFKFLEGLWINRLSTSLDAGAAYCSGMRYSCRKKKTR